MKTRTKLFSERRPGESAKAFAAFIEYRDMGPERSTNAVAQKSSKSISLLKRWSKRHGWTRRVAAFDAHIEETAREAEERALKKKAVVWAKRMQETREKDFQQAQALRNRATQMLRWPLTETKRKDGTVTLKPAKWSFADVARMIETASKLERLATGLHTERTEHSGPEGGPIPIQAPSVTIYLPDNGRDKAPQ